MTVSDFKNRPGTRGNTLIEYCVIGVCLMGLAIPAFMIFGDNLNDMLQGLKADIGNKKTQTAAAKAKILADQAALLATQAAQASTPTTKSNSLQITLSSGHVISLDTYPADLTQSIQATGANGATSLLADQITTMAQQLLDQGTINQTQFNQLASLSNQGHQLADIEQIIEQIHNQYGSDPAKLMSIPVTYNGKTYPNAEALSDTLSASSGSAPDGDLYGSKFDALLSQAQSLSIMQDPTINSFITSLGQQINTLAMKEERMMDVYRTSTIVSSDSWNYTLITAANSVSICKQGGTKYNGLTCPSK